MADPGDFDELHHNILDILAEGRSTPSYLAKRTGESRQLISQRLRDLVMADYVQKVDKGLYELGEQADRKPRAEKYIVKDDPEAVTYGPSDEVENGYVLTFTTGGGERVDVHFPEDVMYALWTEVQHTPWPETLPEQDEAAELRQRLVDRAMGADAKMLQDALDALGGGERER